MIVEDKRRTTTFDALEQGDTFIHDSCLYMVLDFRQGEKWNAVRLWNGERMTFAENVLVERVRTRVVIE